MGMSLTEFLQKHSFRQLKILGAWAEEEWNKPSRSDHYLMQIALKVIQANAKNPEFVDLDKMKIKFATDEEDEEMSVEEATMWAKAKLMGMVGGKVRVIQVPKDG